MLRIYSQLTEGSSYMIDICLALDQSVSPHTGVWTIQNTGVFCQAVFQPPRPYSLFLEHGFAAKSLISHPHNTTSYAGYELLQLKCERTSHTNEPQCLRIGWKNHMSLTDVIIQYVIFIPNGKRNRNRNRKKNWKTKNEILKESDQSMRDSNT